MDWIAEEEAEVALRARIVLGEQPCGQRNEREREQRRGQPAVRPRRGRRRCCRDLPHRLYRIAELGRDQGPAPNGSTTSKRPGSAITTRSDSGSAWPGLTTSRPGTLRMNSTSSTVSEMTSLHVGSGRCEASGTYRSRV